MKLLDGILKIGKGEYNQSQALTERKRRRLKLNTRQTLHTSSGTVITRISPGPSPKFRSNFLMNSVIFGYSKELILLIFTYFGLLKIALTSQ